MSSFLLEIGLEEIPARMIAPAQAELARRVEELLTRERLVRPAHEIHSYSTPRRLAVLVRPVSNAQEDSEEQLTGPALSVAFKDGVPTAAAHAFAKKAGVPVAMLKKTITPKGEYVAATAHRPGRTAAEILAEQLPRELAAISWPKTMYWRAGKPERFVRPVKWIVALLNHAIVPVEFAGVHASNITYGHRILHEDESVTLEHATDYLGHLEAAHVTADVELRRHRIRKALDAATRVIPGARWREDRDLLDTVTHLTEWPTVILGSFDSGYLNLPEEVLVTVMRDHQKYFAVEDATHHLAPYFLAVLNTQPEEHGDEIIRHGNERVLRARFNDARFFWDFDQKIPLAQRLEKLKSVTFQKDLGSYHQKTEANLAIAGTLADLALSRGTLLNKVALLDAVTYAKTDLTTELVKEFTELQGIVGGLYAHAQGMGETAARAIYWQYSPAGMEDPIPSTIEGQLLGVVDRLQTVSAMFGIGLEPTGSKDPFGLRRAGNGIIKILAHSSLPFDFADLENAVPAIEAAAREKLAAFFAERLEFYLREVRGFAYDVTNAILPVGRLDIRDIIARAEALTTIRHSEDFIAVSAAFRRMKNILKQAADKGEFKHGITDKHLDESLLKDPAERALHRHAISLFSEVERLRTHRHYLEALELIATLRPYVDQFFEKVMVMAPEIDVRENRLSLVARVLSNFSSIADFSEVVTG
jgi:glycyl-tRNA synthetase beta chain